MSTRKHNISRRFPEIVMKKIKIKREKNAIRHFNSMQEYCRTIE